MKKEIRLSVRIETEDIEKLKYLSKREGISCSDYVRRLIKKAIK